MTEKKSSITKQALLVTAAITLVCFAGVYPQFQLAPLQALVQDAANLTEAQYTQAFTGPNIPGVLLSLVAGVLIDRFGHRKMIALAVLLSAIGAFGRMACGSYLPFMIAMALTGLTPTFAMCNGAKIMSHYVPQDRLNIYAAFVMIGANLSSFTAATTTHLYKSANTAFLVSGALAVASLIVWLLCVKREKHPAAQGASAAAEKISVREALKSVAASGRVWRLSFCMIFMQTVYITISSSAPTALQAIGYSAVGAGLITSALSVGCPFGSLLGSSWVLRSKNPKRVMIGMTALTTLAIPLLWASGVMVLSMAAFAMAGFTYGALSIAIMSIPIRFAEVGQKYAGTAGGLIGTMQNLGGFFVPSFVVVPLAGGDYRKLFLLIGAAAGLGCLSTFLIPKFAPAQRDPA